MWDVTEARLRAGAVAVPPLFTFVLVLTGLNVYAILSDHEAEWGPAGLAQAAAADPYRYQLSYLLNAINLGMGLIAVLAICSYLRAAGERRWSFLAVPLLILGHGAFIYHEGWAAMIAPAIGAGASGEGIFETLTPGAAGATPHRSATVANTSTTETRAASSRAGPTTAGPATMSGTFTAPSYGDPLP